jgi:hypothetical protein
MTARKYKAYTLWLKWNDVGWHPEITVLSESNPPCRTGVRQDSPRALLLEWIERRFAVAWGPDWRSRVRILPAGRRPKG